MDHFIYTAASGAREVLLAQAVNSHNLANVSTPGFKADLVQAESRYLVGAGEETRVFGALRDQGVDFSAGPMQTTGRDLDVAIVGDGWMAVRGPDGTEGLTRRGDLRVDPFGQLTNGAGQQVFGNDGPIALPPFSTLTIGTDGTVSIVPIGGRPDNQVAIDRIKLVNPPAALLEKGPEGLLRLGPGLESVADAAVRLTPGALEGSNVNSVSAMVKMIELAREYETHVRMMKIGQELDSSSAELMSLQ
ncbi:flagellar basal body rod protein FlgF [Pseudohaliea sp.]|uniref:flagellar basal body rod protein FlgF n=1 Tax=Pseudohaliea sp. TaxID=2740289 RepID=UPI0032EE0C46